MCFYIGDYILTSFYVNSWQTPLCPTGGWLQSLETLGFCQRRWGLTFLVACTLAYFCFLLGLFLFVTVFKCLFGDTERPFGDAERPFGDTERPFGDTERPFGVTERRFIMQRYNSYCRFASFFKTRERWDMFFLRHENIRTCFFLRHEDMFWG